MKKILVLMLALLMVLSAFAMTACDGNDDDKDKDPTNNDQNNGEDEPTDDEMKVTLSDAPLDIPEDAKEICEGYNLVIMAPLPNGGDRFVVEEPNGTPINDAIYDVNLAMEDILGVTMSTVYLGRYTHDQSQGIIDDIMAGSHQFDVAAIHSTSSCAALIMADAALSFDYLEYCDLSKPWWDKGFQETCALAGQNFFAIGSSCYGYYNSPSCLMFNKDLAEDAGLPDLYDLVRNGEWTVDKLLQVTKNFSQDLNNDGVFTEEDRLAIVSDDHALLNYWYGAFRQSTVERGENDEPIIVADGARMALVVEKVNSIFHTGRRGLIYPMSERWAKDPYITAFAEGRILFYVGAVGTATYLREYDIDFGIIPFPKLDENQDRYGAWVDPWHLTLVVPSDHQDPMKLSIMLETLNYYSYHITYPAVVEKSIFGTGTRDTESLEMIEKYIYPNIFFDFGYIYDSNGMGYGKLLSELIPQNSSDIASYVAEKRNKVEQHYGDLYDAILALG